MLDLSKLSLRCQGIGILFKKDESDFNDRTYYNATFHFLGVEVRIAIQKDDMMKLSEGTTYQVDGVVGDRNGKQVINLVGYKPVKVE